MEPISLKKLLAGIADTQDTTPVTEVVTDSRRAGPGCVFAAIRGERVDGHDFAAKALAAGAAAVIAERPIPGLADGRVYQVANTRDALIAMAGNYRAAFEPVLVGITGSVGKTTTKEFCAAVFSAFGPTLKTEGNQNNEIGMPATLFRLTPQVRYAVVEMGMDHKGDLHKLTGAARPCAAVITRIGVSHIENLGSQENILAAKMEICDGLPDDGLLVVNGDDPRLAAVQPPRRIQKVQFGIESAAAQVVACGIESSAEGERFTIRDAEFGEIAAAIPAVGRHNIYNALAAYTLATRLGLDPHRAAAALADYRTTGMRQKLSEFGGVRIIEDCYNANPDSMRAALEALSTLGRSGRRVAVLGDMLELGAISDAAHREVGRWAAEVADCLITYGAGGALIAEGAKEAGAKEVWHCATKREAAERLRAYCRSGDTVLFKASRGMAFEEILQEYRGEQA